MNTSFQRKSRSGITLLEVMIVIAILAVLTVLLLPYLARPRMRSRIGCINMLKQNGLAFRNWAIDNGDKFPMSVPATKGGTMDSPFVAQPWVHFLVMSNELTTPQVLRCPLDQQVKQARAFDASFGSNNVSYFVGLDADESKPQMLLSGDRNLTLNGKHVAPGLINLATNANLGWTKAIHKRQGNVGLADGSAQQTTAIRLSEVNTQSGETNRLAVP